MSALALSRKEIDEMIKDLPPEAALALLKKMAEKCDENIAYYGPRLDAQRAWYEADYRALEMPKPTKKSKMERLKSFFKRQ